MSNIFRDNAPRPTVPAGIQIDRKRLQRLREKKMPWAISLLLSVRERQTKTVVCS